MIVQTRLLLSRRLQNSEQRSVKRAGFTEVRRDGSSHFSCFSAFLVEKNNKFNIHNCANDFWSRHLLAELYTLCPIFVERRRFFTVTR